MVAKIVKTISNSLKTSCQFNLRRSEKKTAVARTRFVMRMSVDAIVDSMEEGQKYWKIYQNGFVFENNRSALKYPVRNELMGKKDTSRFEILRHLLKERRVARRLDDRRTALFSTNLLEFFKGVCYAEEESVIGFLDLTFFYRTK